MSTIARLAALACIATILATFVCPSSIARAEVVYDYTGATMAGTQYGPGGPDNDYEYRPYLMTLYGTIALSAPLAPNLLDAVVVPDEMAFNLGAGTPYYFGDPSPGGVVVTPFEYEYEPAQYLGTGNAPDTSILLTWSPIEVSTDTNGDISGWDLSLSSPLGGSSRTTAAITDAGDSEFVPALTPHGTTYSVSNDVAGTWTEQAPEIDARGATAGLTLLAGVIAWLGGRNKPRAPAKLYSATEAMT